MQDFIHKLQNRLTMPLPYGQDVRSYTIEQNVRICAVMIALYEDKENIYIPLMLRTSEQKDIHSGQISLPGGGKESQDHDLEHTAIRETAEEIGVSVLSSQILGRLSDIYIPPSRSLVTPYVAFLDKKPSYEVSRKEVAKMLDISLKDLQKPENQQVEHYKLPSGQNYTMPAYHIDNYRIWGATARILSELLLII